MKYEQLSINDNLNCPEGGDAIDDCADCIYGTEYHCVNGECVRRTEDPSESFLEPPKEVHR